MVFNKLLEFHELASESLYFYCLSTTNNNTIEALFA